MLRIKCPFCGPRDEREFEYCGPYRDRRPGKIDSLAAPEFLNYLIVPENPEGEAREFWWHRQGCGEWLLVIRDTRTHQIIDTSGLNAK